MLKKSLAVLLAVAMTASLAVGCTPKKTEPASSDKTPAPAPAATSQYGDTGGLKLPLVDKPTTLTWMLVSSVQGLNDKLVIKEIEKRTGIKLDIQAVPAQSYAEKAKITIASGKLPDIMHGQKLSEVNTLGSQGAIAPITKYLDKLPNFKKLYVDNAENNWVMKSWTDDKGDLYTWPIYGVSRDVNHGFLYRKDILDKNGIKEWTNTEEFYQAMKKLKEIYPNSTPIVSKTQANIFRDWAYGWGIGGTSYPAAYDEKTKEWKLATTSKEFKDMLDFMKKLYNEGLLDPEFVTDTQASWTAKMTQNDKAFVTYDWIGRLDMFYDQVKSQIPDYNLRYANPVGPTGNIRTLNKVQDFGIMVANNDKKEIALKLLDYLTSPSGAELITMGVKGVSYEIDSAGKITYPELKDLAKVEITNLENKYGCWLEGMYVRTDPRSAYFNYTAKEQEAQDKINKAKKYEPLDPVLKFTNDENAKLAEILASLQKEADTFSTKYIVTKSHGEKEWNEWLQKAEKLGAKQYIDIFSAAQKRFLAGK
jgi:putative aldouronate transport system substrate-binding protein